MSLGSQLRRMRWWPQLPSHIWLSDGYPSEKAVEIHNTELLGWRQGFFGVLLCSISIHEFLTFLILSSHFFGPIINKTPQESSRILKVCNMPLGWVTHHSARMCRVGYCWTLGEEPCWRSCCSSSRCTWRSWARRSSATLSKMDRQWWSTPRTSTVTRID